MRARFTVAPPSTMRLSRRPEQTHRRDRLVHRSCHGRVRSRSGRYRQGAGLPPGSAERRGAGSAPRSPATRFGADQNGKSNP